MSRFLTRFGIRVYFFDIEGGNQMGKILNTFTMRVSTCINDFAFENDFNGYTGVHVEHGAFGGEPIFSDEAIADSSIDSMDRIISNFVQCSKRLKIRKRINMAMQI